MAPKSSGITQPTNNATRPRLSPSDGVNGGNAALDVNFDASGLVGGIYDGIIRVISKLLIPYILLFGFYVQFHGDFGPGGGFQAGVILASAFILYGLVFGLEAVNAFHVLP